MKKDRATNRVEKVIQAVAQLLRAEPGHHTDRVRLLKLLYIAERESWRDRRVPILGGSMACLEHGPLHEYVYDLIREKGPPRDQRRWSQVYGSQGYLVHMKRDPGTEQLSEYERVLLAQVSATRQTKGTWEIVRETHGFPEWKNPGCSSRPLPLRDLLDGVGRGQEADELVEAARYYDEVDRLLGNG
jgi:uncharacterized phage-associated protein